MYADNGGTGFSRKMERLGGFMKYKTQSTVRDRDEREEDLARWFNCTLTEEPLEDGEGAVVVDRLGSLFNKEPVLKALRDKAVDGVALPQRLEHITGMKAITTLKLHRAESRKSSVKDSSGNVNAATCRLDAESRFSCPISGLDFNGKFKFFALVPSGIVVSDRAMREAKAAVDDLIVGAGLEDQTLVPINPKGDELDAMKEALDGEAEKKAAKIAKSEAEAALRLAMAASKLQSRVRMKRAQQRRAQLQKAQADQAAGVWKEGTQKGALEELFEAAGGAR